LNGIKQYCAFVKRVHCLVVLLLPVPAACQSCRLPVLVSTLLLLLPHAFPCVVAQLSEALRGNGSAWQA
jgi:hypothetical protein